ncbi:FAD:protein FMN transferase [Evansella cellulosilytica]|uniref:FAD:protein FMN transferase n=1 Tax=Evansella cellulosilytica (strain ATCC 21833 / DSM 2522 / FERM P-1141 / JCM 9156 / N-4) TaxID=649639 RepID=E6U1E2_EVAC2|nr:FAD:protein FMN transferase [Evansella cellulosilytica]ADU29189.1 ApbE family lipoprotein [Evansella cellulosilytica DSM 2522]
MKKFYAFVSLISLAGFLIGCGSAASSPSEGSVSEKPIRKTEMAIGTVVTLRIYDEGKEEVMDAAFERIHELGDKIAVNIEGSDVDNINENAGVEPVEVSPVVFKLVERGITHAEDTSGLFNIAVGPLTSLWNIGFDDARKPEQHEIDEILPLMDHTKIEINKEKQTVFLAEEGMRLDLGGIAKGYIADLIAELMVEHGVTAGIIDLGGDIIVIGNNPSGKPWSIGIQDPLASRGQPVGTIDATDESIVTSGIYERILKEEDGEYHHLLNPFDGYPFMNELAGVTIVSEESIDGDAYSTAVFGMGVNEGFEYVENVDGVDAVFVTRDREIFVTSGLVDRFTLTNENYEVVDLPQP